MTASSPSGRLSSRRTRRLPEIRRNAVHRIASPINPAMIGSRTVQPVTRAAASPRATPAAPQTSVRRLYPSASRARESVSWATLRSQELTKGFTTTERAITPIPRPKSSSSAPFAMPSTAPKITHPPIPRSQIPPKITARNSKRTSPSLCDSSGGEAERRTATKATTEAARSVAEWTASERTLTEPVKMPVSSFTTRSRAFEEIENRTVRDLLSRVFWFIMPLEYTHGLAQDVQRYQHHKDGEPGSEHPLRQPLPEAHPEPRSHHRSYNERRQTQKICESGYCIAYRGYDAGKEYDRKTRRGRLLRREAEPQDH